MNLELALEKLKRYCAYQERCHQEVIDKAYKLGLYKDQVDEAVITLIQENFLNEERYAQAYVSGKFRIKKWGRTKIVGNLKQKRISEYCIKKGLKQIEEIEYLETLQYWMKRKEIELKELDAFKRKGKIAAFLMQKGFESSLVWEELNSKKTT